MNILVKKQYLLKGLCCANCADKILREIKKLPDVQLAELDFVTTVLTLEAEDSALPRIEDAAGTIVRRIEPDVVMTERSKSGTPAKACTCCHEHEGGQGEKRTPHSALGHADDNARHRQGGTMGFIRRNALKLIGAVLYAAGFFAPEGAQLYIFLAAYLLIGGSILLRAVRNIARGEVFDENFLMSIASIGAFAIGNYPEAVAVMLLYQIGEAFEHYAVDRSRRSIASLMDIRPDVAHVKTESGIVPMAAEDVAVGSLIVVRPGEKIPLDGTVQDGFSQLDTSALTGESLPRDVLPGDAALAGSINLSGVLTITVTKPFAESTVSKILELVESAGSRKSKTESFITRFARAYTPAVVGTAVLLAILPPLLISGAAFTTWLSRALMFLVVSCPCALVISVPLSYFGGIGGASRSGILVKGGNYLDALARVTTAVFDKTGTLTKGAFSVTDIVPRGDMTAERLLEIAAHAESISSHPIARSVVAAYGKDIDPVRIAQGEETAGYGVRAVMGGSVVHAGSARLMEREGVAFEPVFEAGSVVYLAQDGTFIGHLVVADTLKPDSKEAIESLRRLGIEKTALLSGDTRPAAEAVGKKLGIGTVYAELLPHQKVEHIEELKKESAGPLLYVGDGINDAPVLAIADVGIAMGALGSDASIEAADVVLMTDEPRKIADAVSIARKTRRIVTQNIAFSLAVKGILLVLSAFGVTTLWEAVFGDVGVSVIAILNAMRALRHLK
ncbi:MAG TPA: cadmium-translocating P-type ATPase [Papillibacter sp.]|nr:cadmium-translocating P-type ATPase [Papillibacter sp.]